MSKFYRVFTRLGYHRAANELNRMGYTNLAAKLQKEAQDLG